MGKKAIDCGSKDIMSNGNGALMRIMPFCLLKEEYRRTFNFDDASRYDAQASDKPLPPAAF